MQSKDSVAESVEVVGVRVKSIERMNGKQDVYCLATEKNGNFLANGIFVGNCDALRYAVFSAFPSGEISHPDENLTIEEIRRNVYGQDDMLGFHQGTGGYV